MPDGCLPVDPPAMASSETALLSLRGVRFAAGGRDLIRGLDADIMPGRCSVIMGANGAGKSLLLRLMHGLLVPDEGRVLWDGRDMDQTARRDQAMVFQRPVMLRRSVRANLAFALAAHRVPRRDRRARVDAALARARLEHLADRPARVLSGGEQQRLALARALICQPRLLFLDEPTASLDPASIHAIETLLRAALRSGVTLVLVTHDAGQARRLGDDILFMHNGQIAEAGPLTEVLTAPRSEPAKAWLEGRLPL